MAMEGSHDFQLFVLGSGRAGCSCTELYPTHDDLLAPSDHLLLVAHLQLIFCVAIEFACIEREHSQMFPSERVV